MPGDLDPVMHLSCPYILLLYLSAGNNSRSLVLFYPILTRCSHFFTVSKGFTRFSRFVLLDLHTLSIILS